MEYTTNYNLPTWAAMDRIMMSDFNDMTEKLDEALSLKGNCGMGSKYHGGNGKYGEANPCVASFQEIPRLLIVTDREDGTFTYKFRWYSDSAEHQFNLSGHRYSVVAFYNP